MENRVAIEDKCQHFQRACEHAKGFQENHGAQELLSSPMKLERTSQEQSVRV